MDTLRDRSETATTEVENARQGEVTLDILTGNKKHKLSGSLRFHRAKWYLNGFFTVDKDFGSKIEQYLREFENYITQEEKERKSFVVALQGDIGSGKSLLAKNLDRNT